MTGIFYLATMGDGREILAMRIYLIGITGNIGTGKSLVRKMLEKKGVLGIDADALVHRSLMKGNEGYHQVVQVFGEKILDGEGEIVRKELARIVFGDTPALARLEAILHPLVTKYVKRALSISSLPILAVEAIKLLESDLADMCGSIWVVDADPTVQVERLKTARVLSLEEISARLKQQSPAETKKQAADIVIANNGGCLATWQQMQDIWAEMQKADEIFKQSVQDLQTIIEKTDLHVYSPADIQAQGDMLRSFFTRNLSSFPGADEDEKLCKLLSEHTLVAYGEKAKPQISAVLDRHDFVLEVHSLQAHDQDMPIPLWQKALAALEEFARQRFCDILVAAHKNLPDGFPQAIKQRGFAQLPAENVASQSSFKMQGELTGEYFIKQFENVSLFQ